MVAERKGTTVLDQLYLFFYYYTMEKLLQLLNEYDKNWIRTEDIVYSRHYKVISKKFWFIQWLIDGDKINLAKDVIRKVEYDNFGSLDNIHYYSSHKSTLILLAIQDDPIEFLVYILK